MPRSLSPPLSVLGRPLTLAVRRELERSLSGLLSWQRDLGAWPRIASTPAGTPIVSLFLDGTLRGCNGMSEGPPRERLARAFLHAVADPRFGGVAHRDRGRIVAQVAYPIRLRRVRPERVEADFAPGVHGLVLSMRGRLPTVLLPDVAREHELDAAGFLRALEHKAALARSAWGDHQLHTFETERVVVRPGASPAATVNREPTQAAVRWLAAQVSSDGSVHFGVDPRTGERQSEGIMSHGRAAVVVQALALHPAGRHAARRARAWLERQIVRGIAGRLPSFPREVPLVAGTLALAKLAGIACDAPLREIAGNRTLEAVPWHAAQVVCALGAAAPERLYRACVSALDSEPRAPWTALAAAARGDRATHGRVARALTGWVPRTGSHAGGIGFDALPEVALTALVAEALAGVGERAAQATRRRALRFMLEQQLLGYVPGDVREPAVAFGAFPLTPVHAYLRSDVTAHALLALHSAETST